MGAGGTNISNRKRGALRHQLFGLVVVSVITFAVCAYLSGTILNFLAAPFVKVTDFDTPWRFVFVGTEWFEVSLKVGLWGGAYVAVPMAVSTLSILLRKRMLGAKVVSYSRYLLFAFLLFWTGALTIQLLAWYGKLPITLSVTTTKPIEESDKALFLWIMARQYIEIVMRLTLFAGFASLIPLVAYAMCVPNAQNSDHRGAEVGG